MEQAERCADPIDEAANLQAYAIKLAIANAKNKPVELAPIGKCHWCKEPWDDLRIFCDPDCNHDYTHHKQNKVR